MLSDRRRKVLNALIEEYISTASPVSSRAIVGKHGLGVSSATVRNELYVLEEDGYVTSPHVSSGRIPTDTGYRSFVDELLDTAAEKDDAESKAYAPTQLLGPGSESLRVVTRSIRHTFSMTVTFVRERTYATSLASTSAPVMSPEWRMRGAVWPPSRPRS